MLHSLIQCLIFFVEQALQTSRMSLLRAQKDTQDAFMKYTACLDIERQARQAVTSAEKRRDDISAYMYSYSEIQDPDFFQQWVCYSQ